MACRDRRALRRMKIPLSVSGRTITLSNVGDGEIQMGIAIHVGDRNEFRLAERFPVRPSSASHNYFPT
jgi:hypothetical protein